MEPIYAAWKRRAKAYLKGVLRRKTEALLPSREARVYQKWIAARQQLRKRLYTSAPQKGLLSILTPVWNGSPLHYLRELAQSISAQNSKGATEWVLLDNGCSDEGLLGYLKELSAFSWVKVEHARTNLGITRGLRRCLELAKGRYVMAVDADDLLYPDTLRIVTSAIAKNGYPSLLYTDEDKVNGSQRYQVYLKPDWDPVLLLNSPYIAHLGIIDRKEAIKQGAYSDSGTEGSPDWDLFIRFLIADKKAVHIPEVVYSWRVHATSTADDVSRKSYIADSQRKVLQRFLDSREAGKLFEIEASSLFAGGDHWHFRRKQEQARPHITVVLTNSGSAPAERYLETARALAKENGLFCFVDENVEIDSPEWVWEATGIMDLHPDTVMVGGRLRSQDGRIVEAGLEFGFEGICGSPNRGRPANDPGYFGQVWKQRSVSAVSTRLAVMKAGFLAELLEQMPGKIALGFLGVWAGVYALRKRHRVVYSPFLNGTYKTDAAKTVDQEEEQLFRECYGDLQDDRYYPRYFSRAKAFELLPPEMNEQ